MLTQHWVVRAGRCWGVEGAGLEYPPGPNPGDAPGPHAWGLPGASTHPWRGGWGPPAWRGPETIRRGPEIAAGWGPAGLAGSLSLEDGLHLRCSFIDCMLMNHRVLHGATVCVKHNMQLAMMLQNGETM